MGEWSDTSSRGALREGVGRVEGRRYTTQLSMMEGSELGDGMELEIFKLESLQCVTYLH